jgi:flagellar basal-body rod protein FlgC
MPMFDSMQRSASGMTAHRLWMDVISSNLANADSTRSIDGGPFRRQMVILSADDENAGVVVDQVVSDPAPPRQVYDPGHPDADANGIVSYPNVEPTREMIDMLNASRAYEANAVAMTTAKHLLQRALEIGQR